ncbi:MAG: hypothetical protein B6245_07470 [Desulfobacteraceae bacterium 4572_88]|nr:MAG: hypothetical protein B6245_07470 [Desulfobacteraceae bacterium 4572_88]
MRTISLFSAAYLPLLPCASDRELFFSKDTCEKDRPNSWSAKLTVLPYRMINFVALMLGFVPQPNLRNCRQTEKLFFSKDACKKDGHAPLPG